MAVSVRYIMKLNTGVLMTNFRQQIVYHQVRPLFSQKSLGLTGFLQSSSQVKGQFMNMEESFRDKMKQSVESNSDALILTEDLRVMVHLLRKTPEDIELLDKMLVKFNQQSVDTRFSNYVFGPVVMRAFHSLNEPDVALKLFQNPAFSHFFNQLTTYQILLDLLYCNKRYVEMRTVYKDITSRLTDGRTHPRNCLILVSAACYKENSEESFDYAVQLSRELRSRGYPMVRRVMTHFAALALKQGKPEIALEILATGKIGRYISLRCLKIMAYSALDRLADVCSIIRQPAYSDNYTARPETFFRDAIEAVDAAVERNKLGPDSELVKLLSLIKADGLVQDQTIEEHIDTEINVVPTYENRDSLNTHRTRVDISGPRFVRRPGLRDLV